MSFRLIFILSISAALLLGLWAGSHLSGRKAVRAYILEQETTQNAKIEHLRGEIAALERQLEKANSGEAGVPGTASQPDESAGDPSSMNPETDQPDTGTDAKMRARAEQEEQLFTDPQGREVVASILEVLPDGFTIRRKADNAEMKLPLSLLSEEDQAFHRYMLENKPAEEDAAEDVNWDEIFN